MPYRWTASWRCLQVSYYPWWDAGGETVRMLRISGRSLRTVVSDGKALPGGARRAARAPVPPTRPLPQAGWASRVMREILTATYWLDPSDAGEPYTVTIRFSGRRTGVSGRPQAGDRFSQEETVDDIVPGSGPVSITTRVWDVNPGTWMVTAEPVLGRGLAVRSRTPAGREIQMATQRLWPWVKPAASGAPTEERTALRPFVRIPGVIPGAWIALVSLGVALAVAIVASIVARAGVAFGSVLTVSAAAVLAGCIGGKLWYLAVHRGKRFDGWCIQGFITGTALVGTAALLLLQLPVGLVLDATAPGLFFAVAVGRPGCFVAGCCYGRPTASRWGLWSSDQRVGARRIPTQLLEALLGFVIGAAALLVVLSGRSALPGSTFVGALAAYSLGRQFILPLRAEPRMRPSLGRAITVAVTGLVLIADIALSTLK